jgi:hypothetical protein
MMRDMANRKRMFREPGVSCGGAFDRRAGRRSFAEGREAGSGERAAFQGSEAGSDEYPVVELATE